MCQLCSMLGALESGGFGCDAPPGNVNGPQAGPADGAVGMSGNQDIDGLLWGYSWDFTNLTYSTPAGIDEYGYEFIDGFQAMNALQTAAIHRVMLNYSQVCGLNFSYITTAGGNIRFAEASGIDRGQADNFHNIRTAEGTAPDPGYYDALAWGDTWYNHEHYNSPDVGSFDYFSGFMHEVGHALGLKHGHAAQQRSDGAVTFPTLPTDHDSHEYSVMTYRQFVGDAPGNGDTAPHHPTSLMMDDIAALQFLYGADYATNNGNTNYTFSTTTGEMFINGVGQGAAIANYTLLTVWDGGGIDTYDFTNYATPITADLSPGGWIHLGTQIANLGEGHFARGNIANALLFQGNTASMIEQCFGGSNSDHIYANAVANLLHGLGGNDYIAGTGNGDTAFGDDGGDQLYFIGNQNQLFGGEGNDWLGVNGSSCALVGGNGNEVWMGASGNGNTLDGQGGSDSLFGNGTGNNLYGGADTDWLGCSGSGNALYGGVGNEWMGATGNGNFLLGGDSGDTLLSVGGNFLYGETGDDWVGGSGNNMLLNGAQGNDYLAASGNNNTLDGGAGNDALVCGGAHSTNRFVFHAGYGHDTVTNFSRHSAGGSDVIDLNGFGLSWSALEATYLRYQPDGSALITIDAATSLRIAGTPINTLHASDFIF